MMAVLEETLVATELDRLVAELSMLEPSVRAEAGALWERWRERVSRPSFEPGAHNLACYLALRRRDLRELQGALRPWGLSSLGRGEAHVLATLEAVLATAEALAGRTGRRHPPAGAFALGPEQLEASADELLGRPAAGRSTRILVTLPSEAAEDADLVAALLEAGAQAVRINCAHDDPLTWRAMIAQVRQAELELGHPGSTRILMDLAGPKLRTLRLPAAEQTRFGIGDRLLLARRAEDWANGESHRVGCTLPEIFDALAVGQTVFLDDGKLGARVVELVAEGAWLEIFAAPPGGKRIRSDRGINLPETPLHLPPLTDKDLRDLELVLQHADLVGYSFVQRVEDVERLLGEMQARASTERPLPGLVLKIETREAVRNLPELIVAAAGALPTAVMIARGDLAVELGYRRMAEIQEEILWLCEAAHVPVIWATQVLEKLTKKGTPSRAEVTDAAMSERAECVMLNKGPFVVEAVRLLDDVLGRMHGHQRKKTPLLRALRSWDSLLREAGEEA